MKGATHNYRDEKTGERRTAKSYENCYGVQFFEISGVFDPADETALIREVRAGVHKEAAIDEPCPECQGRGVKQLGPHGEVAIGCEARDSTGVTGQRDPRRPSGRQRLQRARSLGPGDVYNEDASERVLNSDLSATGTVRATRARPRRPTTRCPRTTNQGSEHRRHPPQEKTCPICGETLEDGSCDLCGYIEPPEGFNNPDSTKSQDDQSIPQQSGTRRSV
jgi:ssDNA-binding Zn-finger/Zn-ribbon topoisomerase 1